MALVGHHKITLWLKSVCWAVNFCSDKDCKSRRKPPPHSPGGAYWRDYGIIQMYLTTIVTIRKISWKPGLKPWVCQRCNTPKLKKETTKKKMNFEHQKYGGWWFCSFQCTVICSECWNTNCTNSNWSTSIPP